MSSVGFVITIWILSISILLAIAIVCTYNIWIDDKYKRLRKVFCIISIIFVASNITYGLVFKVQYPICTLEYENVDWDWDDDRDRYEVYIDELQLTFYIKTENTHIVFTPSYDELNYAVVSYYQNAIKTEERYELDRFYLNVGWRGDE